MIYVNTFCACFSTLFACYLWSKDGPSWVVWANIGAAAFNIFAVVIGIAGRGV